MAPTNVSGRARAVILAAGAPHRGTVPAPLRGDRGGAPVLEWTFRALGVPRDRIVVVAGYRAEEVRAACAEVAVVELPDWSTTGSGASLLTGIEQVLGADDDGTTDVLVCYGDILLREGRARQVAVTPGDVVVLWDGAWRRRYASRGLADLDASEKVVLDGDRLTRAGYRIPTPEASGEFVGLVRLGPEAVRAVRRMAADDRDAVRRAPLSELVARLVDAGLEARGIDVDGDWAEMNAPEDIARFVLGTKADTLRRLRGLVRGARIAEQATFTVEAWNADRDAVLHRVRHELGDVPLIVRSSSSHEDAFSASNAGGFTSVLDVVGAAALGTAIERVIASYVAGGVPVEDLGVQQVLVQPMIVGVVGSGVATTRTLEHGGPWRVIAFVDGDDTEAVTGGATDAQRTLVVRRGRPAGAPLPEAATSVASLLPVLDEVESLLGHDGLDVEFAIDRDGAVHLLQVRPLVTPDGGTVTDADIDAVLARAHGTLEAMVGGGDPVLSVMTDWNPAEMIGTAPGALARSLYGRLITDEVWARQRAEYGYRDLRPAPLLVDLGGRPYVDVRRSLASFIPAELDDDLAERLLDEALGRLRREPWRHDKVEFDLVATCLTPDFPLHAQRLRQAGLAFADIERLESALRRLTVAALDRVDGDRATVMALEHRRATAADLSPQVRARHLLADARELGTLPFAHLARAGFVAVALLRGAVASGHVQATAVEAFLRTVRTVGQQLAGDAAAVAVGALPFEELVARWGHLRPGTYDLTSPRYDSDPERFLAPLVARAGAAARSDDPERAGAAAGGSAPEAWATARPAFVASLRDIGLLGDRRTDGAEADRVDAFLRAAIEGREWAKLEFTRSLSDALEDLVVAWGPFGLTRAQLAELPIDVLLEPADAVVAERLRRRAASAAAERRVAAMIQLPPVILRPDDLDAFVLSADVPNFVGSARVVAGVAAPDASLPDPGDLEGRIVLIPRADPGFDWLFGHGIAGLVTLYGGANSHMAIRAAELGLSAAIGVGEQRYRDLHGAALIELDPAGRTVRRAA